MFETFEHTADVGLRVRADDLDALFADAARGLFTLIAGRIEDVSIVQETQFRLEADDLEALLHDWLAELLYASSARRLLLRDFETRVRGPNPWELTAVARGEPIDPARHALEVEIKAITWHGLKVVRESNGWLAEVVVDV